MQPTRNLPTDKPVKVKQILKRMMGAKEPNVQRWLLSGKATKALADIHQKTGIDMDQIADAAIAAIHAALAGSNEPLRIRDAKLRAWLNRPKDEE